jgi:alkaline phosphatase
MVKENRMTGIRKIVSSAMLLGMALGSGLSAQSLLTIVLPERTRLLADQRVDLVLEVRNASTASGLRVTAGNRDITNLFTGPTPAMLDCDSIPDVVYRAEMVGFEAGHVRLTASVTTPSGVVRDVKDILVYPFEPAQQRRNVILFIGDAMAQAYRDAARLVARSVPNAAGIPGLREGFFDNLLEMDKMPVTGTVMTHSLDRVVPDSANTASAWTTGNKTHTNGMGVFPDGTDCRWRIGGANATTLPSMLDNPRVETLWEYLKRKYNYRTGIVSTADIADATPAAHAAHTAFRQTRYEIIRQYLENPFLGNRPAFDVILGGGGDQFLPSVRTDRRDMVSEFRNAGFTYVENAAQLRNVTASTNKLLGVFYYNTNPVGASDGIRAARDPNMSVAYDKLRLPRPGSEVATGLGNYPDQPFLDLMTEKAVEVLAGPSGNEPFILMVEAASIDKQSHVNHAAGTIWDTIELDKAVGWARRWASARPNNDTLLIVTADHSQSMIINGTVPVSDEEMFDTTPTVTTSVTSPIGTQTARVFRDVHSNIRAIYPFLDIDPNQSGPTGPPAHRGSPLIGALGYGPTGAYEFPDYVDADGDGYPENRVAGEKGRIRLSVGFRTGSHTAEAVPLSAEGPGAFLFTGLMDQTDIPFKIAVSLRGDTAEGDKIIQLLRDPRYPQTYGIW